LTDTGRPSHFLDLPPEHQVRDVAKPTFYHISRYINHVQARRRGENVSQFDPTQGDRPWSSAVYNSHGDHNLIEYWPSIDHSVLLGADWYRRLVRGIDGDMLMSELGRVAVAVLHHQSSPYELGLAWDRAASPSDVPRQPNRP